MKTLILITCLLEITLQAPTAQQTEGHEPPSVEIFLPHGYNAADIRRLLPAAAHGGPAGQNGFPGYGSIEYLVPVGDPAQHSGIPAHLRHMLPPQAYIKQKHLHPSHRVSHDTGNPSPSQHTAPREASIEIIMPHGFQGQQFDFQHQLLSNSYHDLARSLPQNQGHVSIEMLFPNARNSLRSPQHLESMPSSQGYIKHEIPQPPGAPSVEVIYPIEMGHQKADARAAKSVHGCHQSPSAA
ncbi:hypothetical protein SKAU_G00271410 [Synaphobranchus kaupii]|uniref:Uncharacterized protein n=1 Tax=Synaphobranchus kaupii TaxID=118154 RepID=A0A9Q1F0C5_SYNKA|nr:hypothetical protein SKAU_G00271410 [Synaphobranchus kaupii]